MSYPVYYVPSGDVLPVFFSTYGKTNGESVTLTGLAVTDIEIYKDVSVTQRASDAGYTLLDTDGIDFDSITGIHAFSIDTGDNTDAGFYTVGSWFTVVVSAVTVDSQTVNFVACQFRIMEAENAAAVPDVNVTHFGGTAGTFSGGRPEVNTSHVAGTAQTAGDLKTLIDDVEGKVDDLETRLGTPSDLGSGATIAANLVDIESQTDDIATVDTVVDAIKVKTDQLTFTVANTVDANMKAISGDTTAADNLEEGATGVITSTCAASSTTTTVETNLTEATNDHYNGRVITFVSGALLGQSSSISDYNGTSKALTVVALTEAPAENDVFVIS